jgi:ketosteroid isomerase-like protein
MLKYCAMLAIGLVAVASSQALAGPNEDAVMNADRAFNAMAQEKGVAVAFGAFAAPNAMTFERLPEPVRGPQAIQKFMAEEFGDGSKVVWAPSEATAARDGTLGTTWGRWTFTAKDEKGQTVTLHGTYLTVWQKQADGAWKYVYDIGQSDLPPAPPPGAGPGQAPGQPQAH